MAIYLLLQSYRPGIHTHPKAVLCLGFICKTAVEVFHRHICTANDARLSETGINVQRCHSLFSRG